MNKLICVPTIPKRSCDVPDTKVRTNPAIEALTRGDNRHMRPVKPSKSDDSMLKRILSHRFTVLNQCKLHAICALLNPVTSPHPIIRARIL